MDDKELGMQGTGHLIGLRLRTNNVELGVDVMLLRNLT